MLRLPTFSYHTPKSASEAVAIAKQHGKAAMYVAGGTDLYPNMKRRHQTPEQVISLRDVPELHSMEVLQDGRLQIGAMVTLTALEHYPHLKAHYPALAHAVSKCKLKGPDGLRSGGDGNCAASPVPELEPRRLKRPHRPLLAPPRLLVLLVRAPE